MKGRLQLLQNKNREYLTTDFELIPKSNTNPYVLETPLQAFSQKTWLSEIVRNDTTNIYYGVLQNKPQILDTVTMVEGTGFEITYTALDPTILSNQGDDMIDDRNLEYRWLKDDGVLHEFSNVNNFKGVNKLIITSESCTFDKSGTYKLQITNRKTNGTTTTSGLTINVLNLKDNALLYKNLIKNGCGEQDMDGWIKDRDIISTKFATDENRKHASIAPDVYNIRPSEYQWEFKFSLFDSDIRLSEFFNILKKSIPNTTSSLLENNPHRGWDPDGGYLKWVLNVGRSCIVDTDFPRQASYVGSDGFFPSWQYIDSYNKNNNLIKLEDIINKNKTYITRDKIKFAAAGGAITSMAQQTIDVSNVSELIDGRVYGVSSLYAHFFAYAGIGISSYKIQFIDQFGTLVDDNLIPQTLVEYKLGMLNNKPPFIPLHPRTLELTKQTYPTIGWDKIPNPYYNSTSCAQSFNDTDRLFYARKLADPTGMTTGAGQQFNTGSLDQTKKITIIPVCWDKVDFYIDYIGADETVIATEYVPGPTEKDIWAIKEKFYFSWHIGTLYGWSTTATKEQFFVYDQPYTTIDAIRDNDRGSTSSTRDINTDFIKSYIYPLYDNKWYFLDKGPWITRYVKKNEVPKDVVDWWYEGVPREYDNIVKDYGFDSNFLYNPENKIKQSTQKYLVKSDGPYGPPGRIVPQYVIPIYPNNTVDNSEYWGYDLGASAFFAVQQDVVVPIDTRYIRVRTVFTHTSDAINDDNPKAKSWTKSTIYYDVFTKNSNNKQTVEYGYPRAAVTAMHLSLHPNEVSIMDDRNTYKVNLNGSVWQQELLRLQNPTEYNSVVSKQIGVTDFDYKYSVATLPEPPTGSVLSRPIDVTTLNQIYGPTNVQIVQVSPIPPIPPTPPIPPQTQPNPETDDGGNIAPKTDFQGMATGSTTTANTATG